MFLTSVIRLKPFLTSVIRLKPFLTSVIRLKPFLTSVIHLKPSLTNVIHLKPFLTSVIHLKPVDNNPVKSVFDHRHRAEFLKRVGGVYASPICSFQSPSVHTIDKCDTQRDGDISVNG